MGHTAVQPHRDEQHSLATVSEDGASASRVLRGSVLAHDSEGNILQGVALQVEFERQTLKPGFHLIGFRLLV
jgi:hypothetical protein